MAPVATELANRHALLQLAAELQFRTIVEVGVYEGNFSRSILQTVPDCTLYSVDPWRTVKGEFMLDVFHSAVLRLTPFGDRSRIVVAGSPAIADLFHDGALDMAYIDGDHRYEAVLADMNAWWPKVRPGGILAGDDYGEACHLKPALNKRQAGGRRLWWQYQRNVRGAVAEFVARTGVELRVTTNETKRDCPNWWCFK